MSFENVQHHAVSLVAAADLSAKQYFAIQVDSNGKAALGTATSLNVGILQNNPTSGATAQVAWGGVSKAKAGGTVAAGARVTSDANGNIIAATTAGDSVIGVALVGGASGDLIPVLINPFPFVALA